MFFLTGGMVKLLDRKAASGVLQAANILMMTMIASRILGYLRDVLIYAQFGQNRITDAYNAAFSIPDFLYMLLVGGALSSAFIPVFSSYIARNQEEDGWKVASIIFNWIMVLLIIGISVGMIFTPQLIKILVPGFDAAAAEMTVNLTRIMFIQVIFMSFSGISMGILNSYKNFTAPAVGGVLYNLGTIAGGVLLAGPIEAVWPGYGIAGFSVGVVLGSMLNFIVQVRSLHKIGLKYSLCFDLKNEGVRELLLLIVPVFIGLAVSQINLFVNQNLASGLADGMVAALHTAQRVMQLPISIFGIAVGVAFFPTMTAYVAKGEIKEFKESFMMGLRSVIFVTVPASVGLAVLGEPVIRLLYEFGGKFTAADTKATAYALLFYTIGIFAYAAIHTLSRSFYALKDTGTPVLVGVFSIIVNILLSVYLVNKMDQGGVALAYSLAGIYNMVALLLMLIHKVGHLGGKKLLSSFIRVSILSLAMGSVVYMLNAILSAVLPMDNKIVQLIELCFCVGAGALMYGFSTLALGMPEAKTVAEIFKRRLKRRQESNAD